MKKLNELKKSFEGRISAATDVETIEMSEPYSKKVSSLILLEGQQKGRFDPATYVEVYDCVLT